MSKNIMLIAFSLLLLAGAVAFDYIQKKEFTQNLQRIKEDNFEVKKVASLQQLWKAKGMKSKIQRVLANIRANKKERVEFKRNKVDIKLNNLSDKELNRVLTKLSMLPIQFKKLQIRRNGQDFILECVCVW